MDVLINTDAALMKSMNHRGITRNALAIGEAMMRKNKGGLHGRRYLFFLAGFVLAFAAKTAWPQDSSSSGANLTVKGTMRSTHPVLKPPIVGPNWLVNQKHTVNDCVAVGGTVVLDSLGNKFCRVKKASCSAIAASGNPVNGWTQYQNWTVTKAKTCPGSNSAGCTGATSCTTLTHTFSDKIAETCTYKNVTASSNGGTGGAGTGAGAGTASGAGGRVQ